MVNLTSTGGNADLAGKTVVTLDGYEVTYDNNGYVRQSLSPTGEVKYYDSLGNQTSVPPDLRVSPANDPQAPVLPVSTQMPITDTIPESSIGATNTTLESNNPGFVYNDQGQLVPADSAPAAEIVQEQQFADGLQEPAGATFDFDGEPLSEPAAQPEELGEESVFDTPLSEPEDPDAENVAEYFPSPDDDVYANPLTEPPGADEDPLALNDEEADGPVLLNASEDELNEISTSAAITSGFKEQARLQQTIAQQRKTVNNGDWRVKLRLAPQANYLYKAAQPGILQPLTITDGIIFPYTPSIDTQYKANYSQYDLTHSNYRGYFYQNSYVDAINMRCTFTAQSTSEADYLLATIHFLKSVTKMFYGQDAERGAPPPLVYLTGLGEYQFNEHPCLVQAFNYNLPADVDYIRAGSTNINNTNLSLRRDKQTSFAGGLLGGFVSSAVNRLMNAGVPKGGMYSPPGPPTLGTNRPTYVPTKMEISISLLPIQSRSQVSKQFSVKGFANGDLLKGGFW